MALAVPIRWSIKIIKQIQDNWAIVTTLFVAILSSVGFLYSWSYFGKFGINYLEHATPADLITVILVHPQFLVSIVICALGLSLPVAYDVIIKKKASDKSRKWQGDFIKIKSTSYKLVAWSVVFLLIVSPYFFIESKVREVKNGMSPVYKVSLNEESLVIPKSKVFSIKVLLAEPPEVWLIDRLSRETHPSRYRMAVIKWEKSIVEICGKNS
ncbi:hypothetical protein SL034_005602 [Vibrio harveyi]|nr:hypothetical protein [Vibrio harveyi]